MKNGQLILFLFLLTTSCNRWEHQYPEDEKRTKLSPTERLQNKTWHFSFASINGVDYTDSVKAITGECSITFNKETIGSSGPQNSKRGSCASDSFSVGGLAWKFINDEQIEIIGYPTADQIPFNYPPFLILPRHGLLGQTKDITILKLTETEFKVSVQDSDKLIINIYKS